MALTDENGNMSTTMLVSPTSGYMGGNGGFGGFGGDSWGWIILLLLFAGGGWGMGGYGMGGYGNMMLGYDFPWLLNGQQNIMSNTNNGFRDSMLNDGITSIRDGISSLATQLCNGFSGVNASIANGFAQAEIANNGRQIANMQQQFANQTAMLQGFNNIQSQFADCCCENRLANCQTQNIIQNEGNTTRFADANNTRDIIDATNRGNQMILDKLCQLELDGVKSQVEAKNDRIAELTTQLNMANLAASQVRQTADIQNNIVSELRSCPIPSQPVYGNQPIFTCSGPVWNNNGCGGGCGNGGF